jgi:hypothetical protein
MDVRIPTLNPDFFWHNPTTVRLVALLAVGLLVATVMLFRRRKSSGRAAAIICLLVSIGLHIAIIVFVPRLSLFFSGGGRVAEQGDAPGSGEVSVAVFDPSLLSSDFASDEASVDDVERHDSENDADDEAPAIAPLALSQPFAELKIPVVAAQDTETVSAASTVPSLAEALPAMMPTALASTPLRDSAAEMSATETAFDTALDDWLQQTLAPPAEVEPAQPLPKQSPSEANESTPAHRKSAPAGLIAGQVDEDFAARQGAAKTQAINATGGDVNTEAAVAAALRYLSAQQRADGAWDPLSSGAGRERAPLGLQRGSAGKKAETALTGLSLLAMLGSGNTHQSGEYQESVYRGLVYLLGRQREDGSLAGDASVYAAHYCHAMASLSLAETAVMTGDESAIEATRRAIGYSQSTQHPITGGWRYTRGDTGDLSQLGWQALLIDGARRGGALQGKESMQSGVQRFLASVRSGRAGGLASYRPGERATATMTAEALATRLLSGENVPEAAIQEAEAMMLAELPGQSVGPDNYYYWYYATLALHQLQDDAWEQWNTALKRRLLATQREDGSWPDTTLWGGYGGTVYTTAMATLCLETYYRHGIRR